MPFVKGHKKVGGRKPGSPDKKRDLFAKCEAKGIDIFDEMLEIALTTIDPSARFNMLRDMASYLYPKRKEVLNLTDHSPEELLAAAEEKLETKE